MPTAADQIREDAQLAILNAEELAKNFTYVSVLEGTKPVVAVKREHGGGPENHQHAKVMARRATFHISDSITDGVQTPHEGDSIIDNTGPEQVIWGLADSKAMKYARGLWSIEFVTATLTTQGFRQQTGL